jgi:hypothetical protein
VLQPEIPIKQENFTQDKRLSLAGKFLRLQLGNTGAIFVKHLNGGKF